MSYKAPYSGISLLIVDDDESIRKLIARIASTWEYETETCASAEDALQLLQQKKFHIIITDMRMGEMDGLTFARTVRAQMPAIPVIIMSGNLVAQDADPADRTEAIYYLQKPISMDKLGSTLHLAAETQKTG